MEPSPQPRRAAIVSLERRKLRTASSGQGACCPAGAAVEAGAQFVLKSPRLGLVFPRSPEGRPPSILVVLVQAACTWDGDMGLRSAPEINSPCGEHRALSVTGPSSQLGDSAYFLI